MIVWKLEKKNFHLGQGERKRNKCSKDRWKGWISQNTELLGRCRLWYMRKNFVDARLVSKSLYCVSLSGIIQHLLDCK